MEQEHPAISNTPNESPYDGNILAALVWASSEGDLVYVKQLLEDWQLAPDPRPKRCDKDPFYYLQSALEAALRKNHLHVAAYFLEKGFKVTEPSVKSAVWTRSIVGLELLLKHGWDINNRWHGYMMPSICTAILRDDIDIVRWFIDHGASVNLKGNGYTSSTPLADAILHASIDIVRLLVSHGARVDEGNLLHVMAGSDRPDLQDVLDYILSLGAPLNNLYHEHNPRRFAIVKRFGADRPLHRAVFKRKEWIAATLLAWGADKTLPDSKGKTPEDLAREIGADEMLEVLRCGS